MDQTQALWTVLISGLTACGAGFLFLLRRIDTLKVIVDEAANMHRDLKVITVSLKNIESALIGDYKTAGLLSKHKDLEKRVEHLEAR